METKHVLYTKNLQYIVKTIVRNASVREMKGKMCMQGGMEERGMF